MNYTNVAKFVLDLEPEQILMYFIENTMKKVGTAALQFWNPDDFGEEWKIRPGNHFTIIHQDLDHLDVCFEAGVEFDSKRGLFDFWIRKDSKLITSRQLFQKQKEFINFSDYFLYHLKSVVEAGRYSLN